MGLKLIREIVLEYNLRAKSDFLSRLGSRSKHNRLIYSVWTCTMQHARAATYSSNLLMSCRVMQGLCTAFALILVLGIWASGQGPRIQTEDK
jgi:hypothetical protein